MTSPQELIPTVDLEDITGEDRERRREASEALVRAFGRFGLVYVKNHGVDAGIVDALYDDFLAFTALPEEVKAPLGRADLWFQRGWTPPNTERAVIAGGQPDFKECYFAAPVEGRARTVAQYPQLYPENIWPASQGRFDAASFRARYLEMGRALHAAGLALLTGAARALALPEATFTDVVEGGAHVTRLLRYLPLREEQLGKGVLWGEEHTDFNLLTLLPGGRFFDEAGEACARPDDRSGLFLRTRGSEASPVGDLVRGRPPEGCIVAQVGQELEILTGGTFLATPHVITTPGKPGFQRVSAAHFVHAEANAVLFPLEPFVTSATLAEYSPPVLAGTYSMKTLVDIGLAPPATLDRLGYRQYGRLGAIRAQELDALATQA